MPNSLLLVCRHGRCCSLLWTVGCVLTRRLATARPCPLLWPTLLWLASRCLGWASSSCVQWAPRVLSCFVVAGTGTCLPEARTATSSLTSECGGRPSRTRCVSQPRGAPKRRCELGAVVGAMTFVYVFFCGCGVLVKLPLGPLSLRSPAFSVLCGCHPCIAVPCSLELAPIPCHRRCLANRDRAVLW